MSKPRSTEQRLVEHVDRIAEEHPPIELGTVDFSIRDPAATNARFGHVLDYMARVELEVDRNVLELDVGIGQRRLAAGERERARDPRRADGSGEAKIAVPSGSVKLSYRM